MLEATGVTMRRRRWGVALGLSALLTASGSLSCKSRKPAAGAPGAAPASGIDVSKSVTNPKLREALDALAAGATPARSQAVWAAMTSAVFLAAAEMDQVTFGDSGATGAPAIQKGSHIKIHGVTDEHDA
jgi:hypothetical protein